MFEHELHKNGFYFTSKYMRIAFSNGKFDLVAVKRNGNYIGEAILCDIKGEVLNHHIKNIEQLMESISEQNSVKLG